MATVVSHQAITSQRPSSNFKASHFLKEPLNVPIKLRQKRFKIQATASQAPLLDPVLSPSKTIPQSYKKKSSNRSAPFLLAPLIKKNITESLCLFYSDEASLILIRHGESLWNEKNLFTGCVDVPLTEKGVAEAIQAGKRISNIPVDLIFTSSLIRAQMTAMLAMTQHRCKKVVQNTFQMIFASFVFLKLTCWCSSIGSNHLTR